MREKISTKAANRTLLAVTVGMIAVQVILVKMGVRSLAVILFCTQLAVLLVSAFTMRILGIDVKHVLRIRAINLRTILCSVLLVICVYPVVALLNAISMLFVENVVTEVSGQLYMNGLAITIFVMAVMPAINEEILMRGIIYRSYKERSPKAALILSALIFGLLHMNFNQMPYAVFLGLIMVLMVEASDSIVTSMLIHFLFNGLSALSGYFSGSVSSAAASTGTADIQAMILPLFIISCMMIPLIILLIRLTCKINHRKLTDAFKKPVEEVERYALPEVVNDQKLVDIWLILAIAVMVAVTLLDYIV